MVDVAADSGWLYTTLKVMNLLQMVIQGRWLTSSSLLTLPHFTASLVETLYEKVSFPSSLQHQYFFLVNFPFSINSINN
jgi:hypothetical protein